MSSHTFHQANRFGDDIVFNSLVSGSPKFGHSVRFVSEAGVVVFPQHDVEVKFSQLSPKNFTPEKFTAKMAAFPLGVKNVLSCEHCQPFLMAAVALKDIQDIQFGDEDWECQDDTCGWACGVAFEEKCFWHFTSPHHMGLKYGVNQNLILQLIDWVHTNGNDKFYENEHFHDCLDYTSHPFGYVFNTPEEHFNYTLKYVNSQHPQAIPSGYNPSNGSGGLGVEYFKNVKSLGLTCSSGYDNISKLLITPRFVNLVLAHFPHSNVEHVVNLRSGYLNICNLSEGLV